jgi:hypothetical protein
VAHRTRLSRQPAAHHRTMTSNWPSRLVEAKGWLMASSK